ncbi:hypothetical protein Peur_058696 [Populus x canadensis]
MVCSCRGTMIGPSSRQELIDFNDRVRDHRANPLDDNASHSSKSQPIWHIGNHLF